MRKKMSTLLPAAVLLSAACSHSPQAENQAQESEKKDTIKPNIVFILADDLGWSQLGCYGSQYYETPHIDRLASQGMRFTNAYAACPVSSPTRASLMTGKYPARLHLTDYIPGQPFPYAQLMIPQWQKFLPLDEISIAEAIKEKGYVSAIFGKWHLSSHKKPPESLPYNPDKQGFDQHFVTYKPWPTEEFDPADDAHNVDSITNAALKFLETHKDSSFFLMVSHNTIHDPLMENPELVKKYKAKAENQQPRNNPVIGAMIETLDKSTGKILKKIDQLNLRENTIVIFFSDNGGKQAHAEQTPLRAGKGWLYEGGIRVPLIVRWHEVVQPGSTSNQIVSSVDLFPTWLEMCGIENIPENDGVSLVPVLKQLYTLDREAVYWHYPHYHRGSGMVPAGAVRAGNFKLIEWYEPTLTDSSGQIELYNLAEDISETNNLAEKMPGKAVELRTLLHEWREKVNAQMPGLNPNFDPKKAKQPEPDK